MTRTERNAVKPDWRRTITPASDLAHLAAAAYGITITSLNAQEAQRIIGGYDGAIIAAQE